MAFDPLIRGRGIAHRLQDGLDPQAPEQAQAFYPAAWRAATGLGSFGMELFVARGTVSVRLCHRRGDGTQVNYAHLNSTGEGSAFSPPILTEGFEGELFAVVDHASDDALFDLYFGTNDPPRRVSAKTAFVISGQTPVLLVARDAFLNALSGLDVSAEPPGYLVLMPQDDAQAPWATVPPHPAVCLMPDRHSAGIGTMGRAIHALGYGALSDQIATHLCLMEAPETAPTIGLFIHIMALSRYLRPEHLVAPPDTAGYDCLLCDMTKIYRTGLPYPFMGTMAGQAYRGRLGETSEMPSLWASSAPVSQAALDLWVHRALQGQIPPAPNDPSQQADWALFRRGPKAVIEAKLLAQNYPLPPGPDLPVRLRRKLRQVRAALGLHVPRVRSDAGLCARYQEAQDIFGTASYWAQCTQDVPPRDPIFANSTLARAAREAHARDTAHALTQSRLMARIQTEFEQKLLTLERRLAAARLLDPERVRADQDRASRAALALLRNRHKGARAVIVGNGPSLRVPDLNRLKGAVTFASNKIYLAFPDTDWRPDYYSVEDHLVMLNGRAEIAALRGSVKLFPENLRDFGYHAPDTLFVPVLPANREMPLSDPDFPAFSDDLTQGIGWGSTVVYSQIQMAAYMGCTEIVLIGLDHSYVLPPKKTANMYHAAGERNHFHPNYRAPGELWHQPNLEVLEVSYTHARDACAARGIKVFNASRQTALSVFERADFERLFPLENLL